MPLRSFVFKKKDKAPHEDGKSTPAEEDTPEAARSLVDLLEVVKELDQEWEAHKASAAAAVAFVAWCYLLHETIIPPGEKDTYSLYRKASSRCYARHVCNTDWIAELLGTAYRAVDGIKIPAPGPNPRANSAKGRKANSSAEPDAVSSLSLPPTKDSQAQRVRVCAKKTAPVAKGKLVSGEEEKGGEEEGKGDEEEGEGDEEKAEKEEEEEEAEAEEADEEEEGEEEEEEEEAESQKVDLFQSGSGDENALCGRKRKREIPGQRLTRSMQRKINNQEEASKLKRNL